MLLSRRKIKNIEQMFSVPYRPTLSSFNSEKEDMIKFSNYLNNYLTNGKSLNKPISKSRTTNSQLLNKTNDIRKSSFPTYNFNSYNNYTIDYSPTMIYPLRNEIIIQNPEEVIRSGCLQGSVRQKLSPSQMGEDYNNANPMIQSQNVNMINEDNNEEEGKTLGQRFGEFKDSVGQELGDATNSMQQKFGEFKDSTAQKLGEVKESTEQKLGEFKESAEQKLSEIGDSVQQKYESTKDYMQDKLGNAKDSVQQTLGDMKESAQQKFSDIGDSAQQNFEDIKESVEKKVGDIKDSVQEKMEGNKDDIDALIPGKLSETVNLKEDGAKVAAAAGTAAAGTASAIGAAATATEEAGGPALALKTTNPAESAQEVVEVQSKKYPISSNPDSVVVLPANYSTDDEDEFNAIKILNDDLSVWEKYTDKEDIKIFFKKYPVKDEKGNDAESCIGYTETTLNFPASTVISKLNDFNFRQNTDDSYKKGKLLSEKMIDGNIKVMDLYLYMKMPFIFSDRDFVVQKKCWLDYNGNKDHALFHIHSIENSEYPAKEKPVRGTYVNRSGYIKPLGENQCKLNVVTCMDIKMSLGYSTMAKNGAEMQEKWVKGLKKELGK